MMKPSFGDQFSERLKSIMESKQLSQKDIAQLTECNEGSVSKWCTGKSLPSAHYIVKLCECLDVSSDFLLCREDIDKTNGIFSAGGISWQTQSFTNIRDKQKELYSLGIETFRKLIIEGTSLVEFASSIGKTATFIRHSLQATLRSRAINIVDVQRDSGREEKIQQLFNLAKDKVYVANLTLKLLEPMVHVEAVAYLAATSVISQMEDPTAIGIASGYTLLRMAELTLPSTDIFTGTYFLPFFGTFNNKIAYMTDLPHQSAEYITNVLANRHPGSRVILPHVDPFDARAPTTINLFRINLEHVTEAFISVNAPQNMEDNRLYSADYAGADTELWKINNDYNSSSDKTSLIGGEILGYFIDIEGNISETNHQEQSSMLLDIQQLHEITERGFVWIVAAKKYKARAVFYALEHGFGNALIIDSEIADYLITRKTNM